MDSNGLIVGSISCATLLVDPVQKLFEFKGGRGIQEIEALAGFSLLILVAVLWPIQDPDFFWHLKIGQTILADGALPTTEAFSHTAFGTPIRTAGWLFDVVLALAWNAGGLTGVRILMAVFVVAIWWLMFRTSQIWLDASSRSLAVSFIGLMTLYTLIAPRPNLATSLGLAATILLLEQVRHGGPPARLSWLVPLFLCWANLHNGFVVGLLCIALYVAGALLDRIKPIGHALGSRALLGRESLIAISLSIAAVCINPQGWALYPEVFQTTMLAKNAQIAEWYSADFKASHGHALLVSILLFIVVRSFAARPRSWIELIVPTVLLASALTVRRNISFWAIGAIAFAAESWASALLPHARPPLNQKKELSTALQMKLNIALVLAICMLVAAVAPTVRQINDEETRSMYPVGATQFLLDHGVTGRLYHYYDVGGYMLWRLAPKMQVFIDGRFFPYSQQVFDDNLEISRAEPSALTLLNKYQVDVIVYKTKSPVTDLLKESAFRVIYSDPNFSVHVRRTANYDFLPDATLDAAAAAHTDQSNR